MTQVRMTLDNSPEAQLEQNIQGGTTYRAKSASEDSYLHLMHSKGSPKAGAWSQFRMLLSQRPEVIGRAVGRLVMSVARASPTHFQQLPAARTGHAISPVHAEALGGPPLPAVMLRRSRPLPPTAARHFMCGSQKKVAAKSSHTF